MSISRAVVEPETGHSILTPAAVVDPCDGSIQGGRVRIFRHLDGDRHLQSVADWNPRAYARRPLKLVLFMAVGWKYVMITTTKILSYALANM